MRWNRRLWLGLLPPLLYLGLAGYQLNLPGLYYDEALDAVPAMQMVLDQAVESRSTFEFAGRTWPLMVMHYVGSTTTYLVAPLFALFGISVAVLRLANMAVAALALMLMWGFLQEFMDRRVATMATSLVAVNPTFIFWSRMGAFVSLPMLPLAIGTLWALFRWYRSRHPLYLMLAAFCLGLGLSTKLLFLWFWVALGLAWLILSPGFRPEGGWQRWIWPLRHSPVQVWGIAIPPLVAGSSMLLLHNLQSQGTVDLLLRNQVETELYGVNNLDVLTNLRTVLLTDFRAFLDGGWLEVTMGGPYRNPLAVPSFVIAVLLLLWLGKRGHLSYSCHRLALFAILLGAILFQSAFTITGLGATHLMILWPIPQALIAAALFSTTDRISRDRGARFPLLAAGMVAALLLFGELQSTLRYHHALGQNGGRHLYSDAIYTLAQDLDRADLPSMVAMDWGFKRNLQLLTAGRVNPEELFQYNHTPDEAYTDFLRWRMGQSEHLYLFHTPEATAFKGHWERFEEAAYRNRMVPSLWKQYEQRDGTPVFRVYTLEPAPRIFEIPEIEQRVDVRLGKGMRLLGYDTPATTVHAGDTLPVTIYWQTLQRQKKSYKLFAHLLDAQGQLWGQYDNPPIYGVYPTTEWRAGEIVPDRFRLPVDEKTPSGTYRLFVGLYDEATGERLPLKWKGTRQPGDTVALFEVKVE